MKKNKIKFIQEYTFDNSKDIKALPFDFYLPDCNKIIEYDGQLHYMPVNYNGTDGTKLYNYTLKHDNKFYKDVYVDGLLQVGNINIDGNVQLQKIDETTGKPDIQRITAEYKDGKRYGVLSVDKDLLSTSIGWSGSSSYGTILNLRGKTVKAPNNGGVTVTSDERLKNSFKPLDEFDSVYMDLEPCAFKYNNGISGRYHFGVTAQNVKESLEKYGYTTKDFAGFVQMSDNPESEDYCGIDDPMGIIYTEFTMWNTHMIQKLYKKIEEQQKEINFLKNSIDDLLNKSNTK